MLKLLVGLLAANLLAAASAFANSEPSYSGLASPVDNAMAGYFNPAALTRIQGKDLVVQAAGGYSTAQFDLEGSSARGSIATDGPVLIPAIYYAMSVDDGGTPSAGGS